MERRELIKTAAAALIVPAIPSILKAEVIRDLPPIQRPQYTFYNGKPIHWPSVDEMEEGEVAVYYFTKVAGKIYVTTVGTFSQKTMIPFHGDDLIIHDDPPRFGQLLVDAQEEQAKILRGLRGQSNK